MTAPTSKAVCDREAQRAPSDIDESMPEKGTQGKAAELGHSRCAGVEGSPQALKSLIAWRTVTRREQVRLNCCLPLGKGADHLAEEQGSLCQVLFPAPAMDELLALVVHFVTCLLWKTQRNKGRSPVCVSASPCSAGTSLGLPLSEVRISNPIPCVLQGHGVGAHSSSGLGRT